MYNTGCYINRFCLSWTILVGKSHCFVCCEQYWLLYIPGLCAMNKTGWYITRFCLLWTVMVGISPSFFCRGQNWLVYQPDKSVVDNTGCYITRFCLLWKKATNERQNRLIYQPILSTTEKKLGDMPTITVHNRQNRVIYQQF